MKNISIFCFVFCIVVSAANASSAVSALGKRSEQTRNEDSALGSDSSKKWTLPILRIKDDLEAIASYGIAWNTGDVETIINHWTDDSEFVYTDALARPNIVDGKQIGGIRNKTDLREYAIAVFKVYPKQIWNENVEVFPGIKPGSYVIYYHFSLFKNSTDKVPTFSGTGMENILLDDNHKLVREEIHLSFSQGQLDSSPELGIPNFYRNK